MAEIQNTAEAAPSTARSEVIKEAKRIEEAALYSSKSHFVAATIWGWYHWVIGLPLVVLAAISGAGPETLQILGGVAKFVPLALLVLSALSTFVDAQKRITAHQAAGNAYDALQNEVRIFRTIDCATERSDAVVTDRLKGFSARKDRQNEMSPATPWFAYPLAKMGIKAGQADYDVDKTVL